jgi:predicted GNAT family N-acyltransferase
MLIGAIQSLMKYVVAQSDSGYLFEVYRPGEVPSFLLEKLVLFRDRQYSIHAPYLLDPYQKKIELNLDLDTRSHHILARKKDGSVVGALRLTPYPFELTKLTDRCDLLSQELKQGLEIGRLITDPSVKDVGKKMMILAGVHAVENTPARGFVGLCRTEKLSYFKNFGMSEISEPTEIDGRPGLYYVIAADFATMRSRVLWNFVPRFGSKSFENRRA